MGGRESRRGGGGTGVLWATRKRTGYWQRSLPNHVCCVVSWLQNLRYTDCRLLYYY